MDSQFHVERVALHLVDREQPEPEYSEAEILPEEAFPDASHRKILQDFFNKHLSSFWKAPEGRRTKTAKFAGKPDLWDTYEEIDGNRGVFFKRSREMAARLHEVSQGKNTTRGLLMMLWFTVEGDDRPYLGLIKMDPETEKRIVFREDPTQHVLLGLAIEQVEGALPELSDKILKWSVIPNPTRRDYKLKFKDQEGKAETAIYFKEFLGCSEEPSEIEAFGKVLRTADELVAKAVGPERAPAARRKVHRKIKKKIKKEEEATPAEITDLIAGHVEGFDRETFDDTLTEAGIQKDRITAGASAKMRIRYKTHEGISIEGPWHVVEDQVTVKPDGKSWLIRIRSAAPPEKTYV